MNPRLLLPVAAFILGGVMTVGCGVTKTPAGGATAATPDLAATERAGRQATIYAEQTQDAPHPATRAPESTKTPSPTDMTTQGLEDVLVPLVLSSQQLERLSAAGVVASPRDYAEFHDLYLETRDANLPVFATSDALLHIYHLTFDQMLSSLEEHVFLAKLKELNQMLLEEAKTQYQQLSDSTWEDAARGVYAYIAVGSKLADPDLALPDPVKELAEAELALINAASGAAPSPIFPLLKYGEDYSQYAPRGHYTKSEALSAYFKAMTWYGRMTFRLDDSENPAVGPTETRMALLLALAARQGRAGEVSALDLWEDLYDPTAFLVGRSDDLTIQQYLSLMDDIYGAQADVTRIADDARLDEFITAAGQLPAPRILGLISDDYKPLEAVKGLRLMGQRFVPDAYIFQQLIHPNVPQRYLPSGLDVMAVMGSERAATWLGQDPTAQIPEYSAQSRKMVDWLAGLAPEEWRETAYNGWLYTLRPLLFPPGVDYPPFMQSTAWQDKQLNTALGSWAELKHDTLLYAKQAYGGLGGCGFPTPPPPVLAQNYVEPVPEVFARIAALIQMTRQDLEGRGLLQMVPKEEEFSPGLGDRLASLESLALALEAMAEKELRGEPLSEAENETLRTLGEYLEEVVRWANGEKPELDPAAIIADVATDPNTNQVLEVAIGPVHEIYAVVPIPQADGSQALTVARGGIFSYYEFPSQDRLTDEAWRALLAANQAPTPPAFTSSFSVPQKASLDIQAVIYRFQRDWANWVFYTSGFVGEGADCERRPDFEAPVSSPVRQQFETAIAALQAQNQYEGRQWINTDYLSVEQVVDSPDRLQVTVRETWSDYLATYAGSDPFAWYKQGNPEPVSARRGPYTVDVRYVLERYPSSCDTWAYYCYQWSVVEVTELTPRPEWVTQ